MSFTTWNNLYRQMLDDLASDAWRTLSGYTIAGKTFSYRSIEDFRKLLAWVKDQAALEEKKPPYRGRMYAANAGRGRR